MDEAGALLGHPYYVDGTIVEGRKRGREIGFPTANLRTDNELIPPHGVYATTMTIDGVVHAGITNIGVRPTFGETDTDHRNARAATTPATSTAGTCGSAFVQRLRDERRFDDVDALRAQIEADRRRAERLFSTYSV